MTVRVIIKNDETSNGQAVIVHFSNDSGTKLLKEGESIECELYRDMCINLIESEEDYSHGESEPEPSGVIAGNFSESDEQQPKEGE